MLWAANKPKILDKITEADAEATELLSKRDGTDASPWLDALA